MNSYLKRCDAMKKWLAFSLCCFVILVNLIVLNRKCGGLAWLRPGNTASQKSCHTMAAEELDVYKTLSDLLHPTIEDLQKIQQDILHNPRPEVKYLADKEFIPREFQLIGNSPEEMPRYYHQVVNTSEEDRENCIIIYASFNERYPQGAERLFSRIVQSDFKGHVDCRIGGWPNVEQGSLVLAHVPFAFKVCFIKEMQKKGYKRVLYLDSSIVTTVSLNKFFDIIKEKSYFITRNYHNLDLEPLYMREEIAQFFGYSLEEARHLLSCSACVFGVDLTNEKVVQAIDYWYSAAQDPHAFYSARSDQTALSLVLHRLGMTDWLPGPYSPYFYIDRSYVKDR